MAEHRIKILPQGAVISARHGERLLDALRRGGILIDAVCGGEGKCGRCSVLRDGRPVRSCRTFVTNDMEITLPEQKTDTAQRGRGYALAFDIGTTTVAGFLIDENGVCASASRLNPQVSYGADVVSRLRAAASGELWAQTALIRTCLDEMTRELCLEPSEAETVAVVGNPAMQQIFLGMPVQNLIDIPYLPAISGTLRLRAADLVPSLKNAELITPPDPSAYVGGDTAACVLSEHLSEDERMTLLVDIGTNGELVLGNRNGLFCCSTAAGPALEGAGISCGMRGEPGAVDRVFVENGSLRCHVIGGGAAKGICGSGLIDAAAAALTLGLTDRRGRIKNGDRIELCPGVSLTQEDIRSLQLSKGAIAAGAELLMKKRGITVNDVDRVLLAGAFGSAIDPVSACRIGLIPPELAGRITAVGNAAGRGAVMLAQSAENAAICEAAVRSMMPVDLASEPEFSRSFAKNMYFPTV